MVKPIPDICTRVSRKTLGQCRTKRQLLQAISFAALNFLTDIDGDSASLRKRMSGGRDGTNSTYRPLIIRLPTLCEEVALVADLLATAYCKGHACGDMIIPCRHHREMVCVRRIPAQTKAAAPAVPELVQRVRTAHDSIKVMTLHVSKWLEFPVVMLVGAARMLAEGEDEWLFYVGAYAGDAAVGD